MRQASESRVYRPTFRVPDLGSQFPPMKWVLGLGSRVPPKFQGLGSHFSDMSLLLAYIPRRKSSKWQFTISRSYCSQMFFKIHVLKNFAVFTEKHLCWSLFLIKLQAFRQFYQKETPTQVLSCEYCEIFKSSFFFIVL